MTTGRKAIFTIMQAHPSERDEAPMPFIFNVSGKIGMLQGELDWRLTDFCRIHQIVYKEILGAEKLLDQIEIEPFSDDINDEGNLYRSRQMDYIIGKEAEHKNVINFVDHMTLVGLWAIAEQFLGRIYTSFLSKKSGISEEMIRAPYKWDDFEREFANLGIDLKSCENFDNANECRVLNNAIKHDPTVRSKLLMFSYFLPFSGQKLDRVSLEMQRYLNGVSDFLGSLIEKVNLVLDS